MSKNTLGKAERLKSRKRIDHVFREGKNFSVFPYKVFYLLASTPGAAAPLQAGFGAGSRNFKKAVDRNRIKRLTREAWRLQKSPLLQLLQERQLTMAVFMIYTGKELPDYDTASGRIGVALQKLIKVIA